MSRLFANFGHAEAIWLLNLTISLQLSWWEVLLLYVSFFASGVVMLLQSTHPFPTGRHYYYKYLLSRNWSTSLIVTGILGFCNAVSNSLQVKTSIFRIKIEEMNGTLRQRYILLWEGSESRIALCQGPSLTFWNLSARFEGSQQFPGFPSISELVDFCIVDPTDPKLEHNFPHITRFASQLWSIMWRFALPIWSRYKPIWIDFWTINSD